MFTPCLLQMNAGVGDKWPDWKRYWGTDSKDPDTIHEEMQFPGMSPEAAQYVVDNLDVKGNLSHLNSKLY